MNQIAESFNNLGSWLIKNLLQMSIELVILAVLVAAVIMLFKIKSPAMRHLFCCLLLAKPVVTILIASPISLYWFLHPAPVPEPEPLPVIHRVQISAIPSVRPATTAFRPRFASGNAVQVPAPSTSFIDTINVYGICAIVWLTIATALLIRFIAGFIYICIIRRRAQRLRNGELYSILEAVSHEIKTVPQAKIGVTDDDCGPVLAGIISPLILMPEKLLEHLSTPQLRLIIAHELMHVKRMDNLVLVVQRLAEIFLFFHPVVWLCGRFMRNDAEAACDNAVLALYGNSADYAESLLRVAEAREKLSRRLLVNTFAAVESDFSKRVKRIARGKPAKMTLGITIFSVITMIVIGCLGLPGSAERKLEKKKEEYKGKRSEMNMKKKAAEGKDQIQIFNDNKKVVSAENNMINMPAPSNERGNTYARGMSEVLSYLGKDISYDRVMGLTGVAFILQIDTSGPYVDGALDCAWWPNDAWGFNLGLPVLSKAAGWDFKEFRCDYRAYQTDAAAAYQKTLAQAVTQSLKEGRPVLAEYDHCFIVTGSDENKPPLLGYGTRGTSTQFKDILRMSAYPWAAIIFDKKITPDKQTDIDIASLRYIVALFEDKIPTNSPTRFAGQKAWQEWLKLLKKGDACDNNMLIHMRYNRSCAVVYLREMAKRYSGKTAEHINAAAKLYKQGLDKLNKQGLPWNLVKDGRSEKEVRAEYTEMAESVLKLETKAIDHLRKALESEGVKTKMTTTVNKKIISDVPVISWGNPGVCSFAAALEAAFKVTKHPYSYNEIMGYSALAFRVRWRGLECKKDGPWWCGSIPVAEFPDVTAGISEQTGWKFKETGMLEKEPEKINEYIPEVIESINKGRPVVGYPTGKQLDCATIYGYEINDGKVFFYWRNLYTGDKENIAPADNTGPWLLFLESWQKAPSAKKRFIASLKQSVINWYRAPSGNPKYYTWSYGKEALEIWIDDLKKAEKYTDKERGELFFVNAWNFGTMRDARKNAVKYLEANIKLLPEKAGKKLDKALKLYKDEVKLFKANPDAFKGPMNGKKVTDWTASDRNRELQILQKALELENKAIVVIREALKAMDIEVKIKSPTGPLNVDKLD